MGINWGCVMAIRGLMGAVWGLVVVTSGGKFWLCDGQWGLNRDFVKF